MAQTPILAEGASALSSTNIVLARGEVAMVGLFSSAADQEVVSSPFPVFLLTPGQPLLMGRLETGKKATLIYGPGTWRVDRPLQSGTSFGVFLDA